MTAMCFTLPSWGVLSEYDLDQTLISLSADMTALQQNVRKDIRRFENRQKEFCNEIAYLDDMCDETAVMSNPVLDRRRIACRHPVVSSYRVQLQ